MLESLMSSPIAWSILSILTIFSTVFAVYTWKAGKKRKQFSVFCKTNEIIIAGKSNIDKLQINYDGQAITDLSCTKFYIWNSGNTVLNDVDIVSTRPVCVKNIGAAEILSAEIVRFSEVTNNFVIKNITNQSVEMTFDYVDHGEGFVLQILHTGKSRDLIMDCKIKGGSETKDRSVAKRNNKSSSSDQFYDVVCELIPTGVEAALLIAGVFLGARITKSSISPWIRTPLAAITMLVPAILGVWGGYKLVPAINQKTHRDIPYSLTK